MRGYRNAERRQPKRLKTLEAGRQHQPSQRQGPEHHHQPVRDFDRRQIEKKIEFPAGHAPKKQNRQAKACTSRKRRFSTNMAQVLQLTVPKLERFVTGQFLRGR